MAQATILVVDDEAGIRESLRAVLEDEGYRVLLSDNGAVALELAREEEPEIVLLDIWLPGMDGLECLARLREEVPGAQVIMISGHASVESAVKATKLGAYDFIEKPLSLEHLLLRVGHALETLRVTRERDALKDRLQGGEPGLTELFEGATLSVARERFEKEFLQDRLAASEGDLGRTAASLGIERPELEEVLRRLGIEAPRA